MTWYIKVIQNFNAVVFFLFHIEGNSDVVIAKMFEYFKYILV